jgi:hypothetical protein
MKNGDVSRRDFNKLTLAALGGALAGSLLGRAGAAAAADKAAVDPALKDPHLCCGLNTCKGHGKGGKNDCAGMGQCATAEAHACNGMNACAAQGGGDDPGVNSCKGKGACSVPLAGDGWKKRRATFEAAMTKAGRKFGAPPKGCPAF